MPPRSMFLKDILVAGGLISHWLSLNLKDSRQKVAIPQL